MQIERAEQINHNEPIIVEELPAFIKSKMVITGPTKPCPNCGSSIWPREDNTDKGVAKRFVCLACGVYLNLDGVKPMPMPKRRAPSPDGLRHYEQGEISERIRGKIPEIIRLRSEEKMSDEQIADRVLVSQTRVHIIRKKWEAGEIVLDGYPPKKMNFQARSGKKPLTEKQIADILALKDTDKQYIVAKNMKVSRSVVSRIWLGKRVGMGGE